MDFFVSIPAAIKVAAISRVQSFTISSLSKGLYSKFNRMINVYCSMHDSQQWNKFSDHLDFRFAVKPSFLLHQDSYPDVADQLVEFQRSKLILYLI